MASRVEDAAKAVRECYNHGTSMVEPVDQYAVLVIVAGTRACAIPLRHVRETMRPLPVEPLAGMPSYVLGLSMVRGAAVPVVDARALLEGDGAEHPHTRLVTLTIGARAIALAVQSVPGVVFLDASRFASLPPLIDALEARFVDSIGTHDGEFLLVLQAARLVPPEVWTAVEAHGSAS